MLWGNQNMLSLKSAIRVVGQPEHAERKDSKERVLEEKVGGSAKPTQTRSHMTHD